MYKSNNEATTFSINKTAGDKVINNKNNDGQTQMLQR